MIISNIYKRIKTTNNKHENDMCVSMAAVYVCVCVCDGVAAVHKI